MSHVQARGYEVQSITADAMTAVALLVSGAVAVVVAAEPISLLPGVELAWTDGIVGRESGRRPQRLRRWGPDGSNPPPSDDGRPRWIHATG